LAESTAKLTRAMRKTLDKARKVIGPSDRVIAYGSGSGNVRVTRGFIIFSCSYVARSLGEFVIDGLFIFPGLLVILVGALLLRPRRGIAVTGSGLVLLRESTVGAAPKAVLTRSPLGALDVNIQDPPGTVQTSVDVEMGAERVRMKRRTYDSLLSARDQLG